MLVSAWLAVTAAPSPAQDQKLPPFERRATDLHEPRVLASDATFDYPAIGEIVRAARGGDAGSGAAAGRCTAALIACDKLVTSAGCIRSLQSGGSDTRGLEVYFQHAGLLPVASVQVPERYGRRTAPEGLPSYIDIAIVGLAEPVSGIEPMRLAQRGEPLPSRAVLVSFGSSETDPLLTGSVDPGIKRATAMSVEPCPDELRTPGEVPAFVCAQSLVAGRQLEGDTGFLLGEHGEIVGIHSMSRPSRGGRVRSAAVAVVNEPIQEFALQRIATTDGEPSVSCNRPAGADAGPIIVERIDRLAADDFVAYPLDVPAGTERLQVTVNAAQPASGGTPASDGEMTGFELALFRPGTFDATSKRREGTLRVKGAACRSGQPAIALSCLQAAPTAGRWVAVVRNRGHAAPFQLTATLVGTHPSAGSTCAAKVSISGPAAVKRDELAVYRVDYESVDDQQARVELIAPPGLLVDPEKVLPPSGVIAYREGTTVVSWLRAQVPAGRVQIATRADPDLPATSARIHARLVEELSRCTAGDEAAVDIGVTGEASADGGPVGRDDLADPMDRPVGWTYYTPSAAASSAGPGVEPPHESILSGSPPLERR